MSRSALRAPREILVVAAAIAAGLLTLLLLGRSGWPGAPTACLDRFVCYCERPVAGLARQPVNTWTNLACFPVAIAIAADAGRLRAAGEAVLARLGVGFALAVAAQGLGSMAFHASLTLWGAIADALAMFVVLGMLLALTLVRAGRLSVRGALVGWAAIVAGALGWRLFVAPIMAPLFLPVSATILVHERRLRRAAARASWSLRAGLAAFAVGALAWALSLRPGWPLCSDHVALQGHGLWHVCAAGAAAALWIHARDELRGQLPAT